LTFKWTGEISRVLSWCDFPQTEKWSFLSTLALPPKLKQLNTRDLITRRTNALRLNYDRSSPIRLTPRRDCLVSLLLFSNNRLVSVALIAQIYILSNDP